MDLFSKYLANKLLPQEYQEEFQTQLNRRNLKKIFLLSLALVLIHLLILPTDYLHYIHGDWERIPAYFYLFLFHISVFPFFGGTAIFYKWKEKGFDQNDSRNNQRLIWFIVFLFSVWFLCISLATNLMLDIPDSQGLCFLFLGSLNPSTFRQRNSNKSGKSFLKSL